MKMGENPELDEKIEKFLKGKIEYWKFSRLLKEVYQGKENIVQRLTEKMMQYNAKADKEKTGRTVRNWMNDRNLPKNREEIFKICFALGLNQKRCNMVLGMTWESGIHFRNPREIVYAFCLEHEIDYPEAAAMVKEVWREPMPFLGSEYREYMRKNGEYEKPLYYTGSIRRELQMVRDKEDLKEFLELHRNKFGIHHNTAYRKFRKMLDCLLKPFSEGDDLPSEQMYSIRKAVEQYLRMGVPYDKKSRGYSRLQKEIKQHWPSVKSIYEMCARKIDVDRKTLLLLYMVTEGEGDVCAEDGKSFSEHRRRMDLMLAESGFPLLNIHCPFDYLVLWAIRQEHEEDFIGLRMERLIRKIFNEEKPAAYLVARK